jgi:hypothetical protein
MHSETSELSSAAAGAPEADAGRGYMDCQTAKKVADVWVRVCEAFLDASFQDEGISMMDRAAGLTIGAC